MNEIPDYINCQNDEIKTCEYFWHKGCPMTCAYYRFLGIGATTEIPPAQSELEEKLNTMETKANTEEEK